MISIRPRQSFALGDAAAAGAVHADGVDFIDEGEGVIFFREIEKFPDRGNVTVHRIDRFIGDDLGPARLDLFQVAFEIGGIVMF